MGNTSAKIHKHITSSTFRAHQIKCLTLLGLVLAAAKESEIRLFAVRDLLLAVSMGYQILPWGDELSLAILDKDVAAFEGLLKAKGWTYSRKFWGIQIRMFSDCVLDVYIYALDHDIRFQSFFAQLIWPEQRFMSLGEILPIQVKKLGKLEIPVPNDADAYLSRVYGTRWRTHCQWHAPKHQNMGIIEQMMHARSSAVNVECNSYQATFV